MNGCRIPLFPSRIKVEKCNPTPPERLFNAKSFSSRNSHSELIIIRDAGCYGAEFALPVSIDSERFAEMQIWETATAYLQPGVHKIEFFEPPSIVTVGKKPESFLTIDAPKEGKVIVRIDLGRKHPPIRQVEN